jgi:hypothetical protein
MRQEKCQKERKNDESAKNHQKVVPCRPTGRKTLVFRLASGMGFA